MIIENFCVILFYNLKLGGKKTQMNINTVFTPAIENNTDTSGSTEVESVIDITLLLILFWVTINIIVPWLVRFFVPKRLFNENAWLFKERDYEGAFYRKIKVYKWKDKLPDAEKLIHFQRSCLPCDIDEAYVSRFITECCIAELGHLTVGIVGFSSLFFTLLLPQGLRFKAGIIFFILSVLDFFAQTLFIIIQRYNRPRLIKLKKLYYKSGCAVRKI